MIDNKYLNKIIVFIMTFCILICFVLIGFSQKFSTASSSSGVTMEYETALFNTDSPIDIDISMDSDAWDNLLNNAIDEEYVSCDVTINGTKFYNVGIRAKGNTSLSSIASDPTTDRYSFKLEFDHYIESQTCFGLDKLILNNNYADATNMKEALVYDMYQFLGADASLYNYAKISVNDEYWGVYLALEGVEDSFMLRNYGVSNGNLYKPETTGGGMGNKDDMKAQVKNEDIEIPDAAQPADGVPQMPDGNGEQGNDMQNMQPPDGAPQMPDGNGEQGNDMQNMQPPDGAPQMPNGNGEQGNNMQNMQPPDGAPQMPDGNGEQNDTDQQEFKMQGGKGMNQGGNSMSNGGADLNYIDDDEDSYSTIWDGEITSTSKKDHKRVIEALKNISEGTDLETYMDVDNILKYLAVHTFAVNLDSLSGNMAHNYYLYENNGQLNTIPWDYNLSWGGFQNDGGNDATSVINFPIDTPFSNSISMEDREFFAALLENEEYLETYHSYLQKLCDEYISGGELDTVYNRIRSQIDSLVETDPTAFYTYSEYDTAADTLYNILKLRGESILGQLNGSIPSTTDGQSADSSALIDGSSISISVMGTMNNGGMQKGDMQNEDIPKPTDMKFDPVQHTTE